MFTCSIKTPFIANEQINKQLVVSLDNIRSDDNNSNNHKCNLGKAHAYAACILSDELVSNINALPCILILPRLFKRTSSAPCVCERSLDNRQCLINGSRHIYEMSYFSRKPQFLNWE